MKLILTKRDKMLLTIVGCILILVCFWQFLISPAIAKRSELIAENGVLTEQKEAREAKIAMLGTLEKNVSKLKEDRREISLPYYLGDVQTHEMDTIVTTIALKHKLFPDALTLTPKKPGLPAPYSLSEKAKTRYASQDYVCIGSATFKATGELSDINAFLDDIIENYPGLRVVSFDMTTTSRLKSNREVVYEHSITCNIDIYVCLEVETD